MLVFADSRNRLRQISIGVISNHESLECGVLVKPICPGTIAHSWRSEGNDLNAAEELSVQNIDETQTGKPNAKANATYDKALCLHLCELAKR